jgi:hypothetical protein
MKKYILFNLMLYLFYSVGCAQSLEFKFGISPIGVPNIIPLSAFAGLEYGFTNRQAVEIQVRGVLYNFPGLQGLGEDYKYGYEVLLGYKYYFPGKLHPKTHLFIFPALMYAELDWESYEAPFSCDVFENSQQEIGISAGLGAKFMLAKWLALETTLAPRFNRFLNLKKTNCRSLNPTDIETFETRGTAISFFAGISLNIRFNLAK